MFSWYSSVPASNGHYTTLQIHHDYFLPRVQCQISLANNLTFNLQIKNTKQISTPMLQGANR